MCLTEEEVIEARKASNGYNSSSLDAALSSDAGAEGETVLADFIGEDDPGLELVDDLSSLAP
jgi:RNA polymerase sigma-B factor